MPFLVIDGVTIPVALNSSTRTPELIADEGRVSDGALRRMRIGVKDGFRVPTKLIPRATANTIYNTLTAAGTRAVSGDLPGGAITCLATVDDWQNVRTALGDYVRLSFTLKQV